MNQLTKRGLPRQRSAPITRARFYRIQRDIRFWTSTGDYSAEAVAKMHSISATTVRAIKAARTWPAFEASKARAITRRVSRTARPADQSGSPARTATSRDLSAVTEGFQLELGEVEKNFERGLMSNRRLHDRLQRRINFTQTALLVLVLFWALDLVLVVAGFVR